MELPNVYVFYYPGVDNTLGECVKTWFIPSNVFANEEGEGSVACSQD